MDAAPPHVLFFFSLSKSSSFDEKWVSISQIKPKSASLAHPLAKQFAAPLHLEDCTEVAFLAPGASLRISAKLIQLQISKTLTKAILKPLRNTGQIGSFRENTTEVSYPYFSNHILQICWILVQMGVQGGTCPIANMQCCSHLPAHRSFCCLSWVTKDVCVCWLFLLRNVMCFLMTQTLIITQTQNLVI